MFESRRKDEAIPNLRRAHSGRGSRRDKDEPTSPHPSISDYKIMHPYNTTKPPSPSRAFAFITTIRSHFNHPTFTAAAGRV